MNKKKIVKKYKNVGFASGFTIEYGIWSLEQPELKQYEEEAFYLKPCSEDLKDKEFVLVSLDDLYEDIKLAVHNYKDNPESISNSVLKLANQYGCLRYSQSQYLSDEEHPARTLIQNIRIRSSFEFDGFSEFYIWESLITKFFPVNLPYLDSWVKSQGISYDLLFLNRYLQGVRVGFTSLKMSKFEVIPNDLVSAIILYIKAKKHKKEPFIKCGYEPCGKIIENNIGKGQPKKFCCNSHRTMANRLKRKLASESS